MDSLEPHRSLSFDGWQRAPNAMLQHATDDGRCSRVSATHTGLLYFLASWTAKEEP